MQALGVEKRGDFVVEGSPNTNMNKFIMDQRLPQFNQICAYWKWVIQWYQVSCNSAKKHLTTTTFKKNKNKIGFLSLQTPFNFPNEDVIPWGKEIRRLGC